MVPERRYADYQPRTIEIDTERILTRDQRHFAVVDIGSNSIRLVVYDNLGRAPFPRFNEKSFCALGADLDATGVLSARAIDRAVHAIQRFHAIADAMGVDRIDVIATEAARRAENGADLTDAIRRATGLETKTLTGPEEASYAALGVISGFFQPKGIVGDLGGGSLEVAEILGDRVGERVASLPIGVLPVTSMIEAGYDTAKETIDGLVRDTLPPLLTDPVFYAVGGSWRALARIHLAMQDVPIKVVHGYDLPAKELRALAKKIARMSPDDIAALPDVPDRRVRTLPAAALVMSRVLKSLKPERVVFSALGLREGWLFSQLDEAEQYRDPLLEGAMSVALPLARVPGFSEALGRWTDDLFPGETLSDRRLRLAVCALTDIAWRDHIKVRAEESFLRLLQFPFIGVTHAERAFIAVAIMARYGGKVDGSTEAMVDGLLTRSDLRRAQILGRALLLGHRFSGSVPDILEQAQLSIEADVVRLKVLSPDAAPDSDAVQIRLQQLAKAAGIDRVEFVEVEDAPAD